jgi:hypothetical protein
MSIPGGIAVMLDEWPLIGRDGERAALAELMGADVPQSVVISSGPGVGRSRLVREALMLVARHAVSTG